ncbi:MAG: hypothetical protein M2R45_04797 [Verrucomicrobia subdivision 3 bacterium]|nr:hypothetical protein [Limisphaerales bacterium]MCS1417442.1 hypothetical protein [Limisphaerales bacterium]
MTLNQFRVATAYCPACSVVTFSIFKACRVSPVNRSPISEPLKLKKSRPFNTDRWRQCVTSLATPWLQWLHDPPAGPEPRPLTTQTNWQQTSRSGSLPAHALSAIFCSDQIQRQYRVRLSFEACSAKKPLLGKGQCSLDFNRKRRTPASPHNETLKLKGKFRRQRKHSVERGYADASQLLTWIRNRAEILSGIRKTGFLNPQGR